jgi:hypothetical protein
MEEKTELNLSDKQVALLKLSFLAMKLSALFAEMVTIENQKEMDAKVYQSVDTMEEIDKVIEQELLGIDNYKEQA